MPAGTEHAIELGRVTKTYNQSNVVEDFSLQIDRGECVVLVGHNGAGKTTLMKLMLGLTRPSAGTVLVQGEDPAHPGFAKHRLELGYLPENVSFYPQLNGFELLRHYARLKNVADAEVSARLEQVGLSDAAGKRLGKYSKGMRQRLGLAQAILGTPKTLYLDEPTTGLDPLLRRDFYQIIDALRSGGTTVVISSHALNEVEAQADRIAVIKQGQLVACGSMQELSDQADLPLRIRISVDRGEAAAIAARLPGHIAHETANDHTIDTWCQPQEKMVLLRHITALGEGIQDIGITTPRLDEIYLHFMNKEKT